MNEILFGLGGRIFSMLEKGPRFRVVSYPSPPDLGIVDLVVDGRISQVEASINFWSAKSVPIY